jgi:hypothetical protein
MAIGSIDSYIFRDQFFIFKTLIYNYFKLKTSAYLEYLMKKIVTCLPLRLPDDCWLILEASAEDGVRECIGVIPSLN